MHRSAAQDSVEKHARMRAYLQHRQRVLDAQPRVSTRPPRRALSHSRVNDWKVSSWARKRT